MSNNQVIGILNFHSSPSLGELTENRSLGATSTLGRYAICDFALSNFTNSGIQDVGLLIKDNARGVLKHFGNFSSWLTNTKLSKFTIMFNEKALIGKEENTDINNIKANDWVLYNTKADYIVIQSCHIVGNIDLGAMIENHISRNEEISVMYTHIKDASKEFCEEYKLEVGDDGYIKSAKPNDLKAEEADMSTEVWIINRKVLADIIKIEENSPIALSFRHTIRELIESKRYKVHGYEFKGFIRCIDSFKHYCEYAFEMLDPETGKSFFTLDWPHYTKGKDTPPALYGEHSDVRNAYISNGAIIDGTVEHSIISRKVKIDKGAKVINSIIFAECHIEEGAVVENCLIDKYSNVSKGKKIVGDDKLNLKYFKQNSRL